MTVWGPRQGALAVLVVLCALFGSGAGSPAQAEFRFCNNTSFYLFAALGYQKGDSWRSEGWWRLRPGQCRVVLGTPLDQTTYYTYAEAHFAHQGDIRTWAGNTPFCTQEGFFAIVGRENCSRRDYGRRDFDAVEVGNAKSWTTKFTEPESYSEAQARIAGAQRLLGEIGRNAGRIDGYAGRRTRRAIEAAKKDYGIEGEALVPDALIDRLIAEAEGLQNQAGYQFCNRTPYDVWAAIGVDGDGGPVSKGWWQLAPDRCVKAIKDKLTFEKIYSYAEAFPPGQERIIWGGDYEMCTSEAVFAIEGTENCGARGYDSRGFKTVDINGQQGWNEEFLLELAQ